MLYPNSSGKFPIRATKKVGQFAGWVMSSCGMGCPAPNFIKTCAAAAKTVQLRTR